MTTATQEIETDEVSETVPEETTDESESKLAKIRHDKIGELIRALDAVQMAYSDWDELKTDTKNAENMLDAKQEKMNRLVGDLRDIENGNYQQTLDFPADDDSGQADDPGKTYNVIKLDITPSQAEKLWKAEIITVAELEAAIGHGKIQNISGLGEKAVDRISDAVLKFREEYPVPTEVDDEPETVPFEESACDAD